MRRVVCCTAALLAAACSENRNPFGSGGGGRRSNDAGTTDSGAADSGIADTGTSTSSQPDAGGIGIDTGASNQCRPRPSRMVILGDSITACVNVGGIDGVRCGPKRFHEDLAATHAPGLTYENISQGGAVTADVANRQIGNVQGGGGHVLVMIYIGGNDLAPNIFVSDSQAMADFDRKLPQIQRHWRTIFDYFDDTAKFPDGVTVLMNQQYNPFDDCNAAPYYLSEAKTMLLHRYNAELQAIAAAHPNAVIADQYTSFLGHGHHHNVSACPFYMSGADGWMDDLIHANALGHANFSLIWAELADRMYRGCR